MLRAFAACNVNDCAEVIMDFNDGEETTQRKVQGLFERTITALKKKLQEARMKRQVKALLRTALTPPAETKADTEKTKA